MLLSCFSFRRLISRHEYSWSPNAIYLRAGVFCKRRKCTLVACSRRRQMSFVKSISTNVIFASADSCYYHPRTLNGEWGGGRYKPGFPLAHMDIWITNEGWMDPSALHSFIRRPFIFPTLAFVFASVFTGPFIHLSVYRSSTSIMQKYHDCHDLYLMRHISISTLVKSVM